MVLGLLSVPAAATAKGLLDEMQGVVDSYRDTDVGLLVAFTQWVLERRFTGLLAVAKGYHLNTEERTRYINIVNSYVAVYAVRHDSVHANSYINVPLIG